MIATAAAAAGAAAAATAVVVLGKSKRHKVFFVAVRRAALFFCFVFVFLLIHDSHGQGFFSFFRGAGGYGISSKKELFKCEGRPSAEKNI